MKRASLLPAASLACIRHHVREAAARRAWAFSVGPAWHANASLMSRQWVAELRASTVHAIARRALDYHRMRAFLNRYGYPWAPIERREWLTLNPHHAGLFAPRIAA